MALMTIFSVSVFAKSGFEFHYNALLGVGVSFPTTSMKDMRFKSDIGFDGTGLFQIGYMRQVKEGFGISLLAELGYSFDSYGYGYKTITPEAKASYWQYYHSFKLGLLPKFNIGAFSIGIGGGVKVPLGGKYTMKIGVKKPLRFHQTVFRISYNRKIQHSLCFTIHLAV